MGRSKTDGRLAATSACAYFQKKKVALILIVSDYSSLKLGNLKGAAWDELRIAAMLARNGFSVVQGIGSSLNELLCAVETFSDVSRNSDMAIIYSTGHGLEVNGDVYLLSSDPPRETGSASADLTHYAVNIASLTDACRARSLNQVFFAGCRTIMTIA